MNWDQELYQQLAYILMASWGIRAEDEDVVQITITGKGLRDIREACQRYEQRFVTA